MVRNYVKETNPGEISQEIFEKACVAIERDSVSLRQSAKIYNIDEMSLLRYINPRKTNGGYEKLNIKRIK